MTVWAIVNPNVLLAAEGHKRDRAGEGTALPFRGIFKGNANRVGIVFVAIYQHERPIAVRTMHGVRSHELVSFCVPNIICPCVHLMYTSTVLYPLQIDHVGGVIKRR